MAKLAFAAYPSLNFACIWHPTENSSSQGARIKLYPCAQRARLYNEASEFQLNVWQVLEAVTSPRKPWLARDMALLKHILCGVLDVTRNYLG